MGTMTRTEMIDEMALVMGNRNDAAARDGPRLIRWLNQAYVFMTHPSVHKFHEISEVLSITMATGTDEYTLATSASYVTTDVVAVRWVTHILSTSYTNTDQKRKLSPRGIRWFEERTLPTSQPTVYTIDGLILRISGVPRSDENNQLLRIGVYSEPALFTAGTSVTVLPSYYDRPLWKIACAFAFEDLEDHARSAMHMRAGQRLLNCAGEEKELESEDTDWQVEFELQPAMGVSG